MLDFSHLTLFFAAALVLLLTPGPSVLYIVTRSVSQGSAAGIASVLGVQSGAMVHVLGATLGVSALIASSATLFTLVKYAGAAYLVYLGVRSFLKRSEAPSLKTEPALASQVFAQGFLVAALNPKTALFFLAFLPQFASPSMGSVPLQVLLLGLIYIAMSCVVDSLYAILSGLIRPWLLTRPQIWQRERYVSGSVYIGLGVLAATTDHKAK
jgi:threonine/homoserine/homoserine lactone efflux protein